jgi:hypothetical protein
MKEIYSNRDFEQVALRRTVLEAAGIPCIIRNEMNCQFMLSVGSLLAFVLPVPEWWPNLCVINDEDVGEACELLHSADEWTAEPVAWSCSQCGEEVPATLGACWNCQTDRPESQASAQDPHTS